MLQMNLIVFRDSSNHLVTVDYLISTIAVQSAFTPWHSLTAIRQVRELKGSTSCFSLSYSTPYRVIFCQAYPETSKKYQWPGNQGCMAGKEKSVTLSWLAWRDGDTRSTSYRDVLCWAHTGDGWGSDTQRLILFAGTGLWAWDNNVIADWLTSRTQVINAQPEARPRWWCPSVCSVPETVSQN